MLTTILGLITGPTGALVVLAVILYGIYKMANEKAWPIVDKYVDNVDTNMKAILSEHKADREVFSTAITSLVVRIDKVEESVENISDDVSKLLDRKDQ